MIDALQRHAFLEAGCVHLKRLRTRIAVAVEENVRLKRVAAYRRRCDDNRL